VIIGNGAAGTYAAEQIRKLDVAAEIVMIDDEPYTLYNRVSLPRYLRGVLLEQRVYVRDMEWHTKNNIELRLETKVDQVSFDEKTIHTEPGVQIRCARPAPRGRRTSSTSSTWTTPRAWSRASQSPKSRSSSADPSSATS
jgi:NADPH-dependent 2,4-dienoyl-CoA reductase/sulfur reductase-like enzyme